MENKEKAPRLLDHVKWTYQGLRIKIRKPWYVHFT